MTFVLHCTWGLNNFLVGCIFCGGFEVFWGFFVFVFNILFEKVPQSNTMATGEDLSLLCIATNYTQIIEQVLSANSPGIVLDSRKQASTLGSVGGKEEKLTWLPSRMFPEVWRRATEKTFAWHLDSSWGKSRTSHLTAARQE